MIIKTDFTVYYYGNIAVEHSQIPQKYSVCVICREMATWEDPDELISCPYDPVHLVQRKRIQYHLMKCRKVSRGFT